MNKKQGSRNKDQEIRVYSIQYIELKNIEQGTRNKNQGISNKEQGILNKKYERLNRKHKL